MLTSRTGSLYGESREGRVYLDNDGELVVNRDGLSASGDIELTTNSPLIVEEDIVSGEDGEGGTITLTANENPDDADDNDDKVTFTNGVTVQATNDVIIEAADGVIIEDHNVNIEAGHDIRMEVELASSVGADANLDDVTANTMLRGTLTAGNGFDVTLSDKHHDFEVQDGTQISADMISLHARDGDNVLTLGGRFDADDIALQTGQGDDILVVKGTLSAAQSITGELGAGNDEVDITGSLNANSIDIGLGSGNDDVEITGSLKAESIDIALGSGNDALNVTGTLDADTIAVEGNAGDDNLVFKPTDNDQLLGEMSVEGNAGEDYIEIVELNDRDARLTLDGGGDTDSVRIVTRDQAGTGDNGTYRITVSDSGAVNNGVDELTIEGRGYNGDSDGDLGDLFLIRQNFIARMAGNAETGVEGSDVERIDYDDSLNGRVRINGHAGDDAFIVDDTSTLMTLDGGGGNDRFQVGQVFAEDPSDPDNLVDGVYENSGVREGDEISTTLTTQGFQHR